MGRTLFAIVCLACTPLLLAARAAAEVASQDPFGAPAPQSATTAPAERQAQLQDSRAAAEKHIEQALDQLLRTPLDFIDQPLNNVMQIIAEEYDIPVHFDVRALEEIAVPTDAEVTVNIRGTSLRSALELILRSLKGVTYSVDHEVLLITSEDEAASHLIVRVYRIDDLQAARMNPPADGAENAAPIDQPTVGDIVRRFVAPDSWANDGRGQGQVAEWPGLLIVFNTARVHRQVDELFGQLRHMNSELSAASHGARSGDRPYTASRPADEKNSFVE